MRRNKQIYTHTDVFTHTQIGHYWLSLHVHVWVVMHRQVQADFSDLPPKGTTWTGHFTFHRLCLWPQSWFLSPSTLSLSFSSGFSSSSSSCLHHITDFKPTHTQTHTRKWPIPSPYLIRQSANQGFVWHWLWISRQMGRWMKGLDGWVNWKWIYSQERSLVIGLLHLTHDQFGRIGWLAWMRLGGVFVYVYNSLSVFPVWGSSEVIFIEGTQ